MPITDLNAIFQAIANVELESLPVSDRLKELLGGALITGNVTTTQILEIIAAE